ncbi:geranylgeranyl reductase family protein [bacterium]|nr:geranylgeranyl reductase family protein [bacterium]
MNERFDLIVVGAGPAGSSCAERAAELGLRVAVFEKAEFPRSKPCAGGLSSRALGLLGSSVYSIIHHSVRISEISVGPRVTVTWTGRDTTVATTSRKEFDQYLAERAMRAGARVEFGAAVDSVTDLGDRVEIVVGSRTLCASHLVAADGVRGSIRGMVGMPTLRLSAAAYARVFPDRSSALEPFLDRVIIDGDVCRGGYGWIFPKRDHLNIGVCGTAALGQDYIRDVDRFIERRGLSSWRVEGHFARPTPAEVKKAGLAKGRILVVGDAGGLADPITGEGISHSIESGRQAAEAIAEAEGGGWDASMIYRRRVVLEILPVLNHTRRLGRLLRALGPGPLSLGLRIPGAAAKLESWMPRLGHASEGGVLSIDTEGTRR